MRHIGVAVVALLVTAAAQAQLGQSPAIVVGAAGGTTFELSPESRPDEDWLHNGSISPSVFLGMPVMPDTLVRLRAFDLPREQVVGDAVVDSHLRGVTVGVDYLMVSTFGRTVFSGGIGSYELDLEGSPAAGAELETWEFGWFVGIGEWIPMTRRTHLTIDLTYHSTSHPSRPQLLSAALGLAFFF